MEVRLFKLSLDPEHFLEDQKRINKFLETNAFLNSDSHFVYDDVNYWSVLIYSETRNAGDSVTITEAQLDAQDAELYHKLKAWRLKKAKAENLAAFMVCHDSHLLQIATEKPETSEALVQLKGFGRAGTQKHGAEILSIVNGM